MFPERTKFRMPYGNISAGEEIDYVYFFHPDIGGFTIKVEKEDDGTFELLISVDDPDFDTSIIGCLTPDGSVTKMPDLRRNKNADP
jgi:hypothetical protein